MNKINYQIGLDRVIASLNGKTPSLLLHSCCAPCSSYVIEYLSKYFEITVFYYNPNISPEEEYRFRSSEQKRLIAEMPVEHPVRFIEEEYDSRQFFDVVKGLEKEPEGGKRCEKCFELRLSRTIELAKEMKFDYVTTTLTISPLKDAQLLNRIGERLSLSQGVNWLGSDFKKKGGYKRSIELSREYDLYRQNYCGCVFSKRQAGSDDKEFDGQKQQNL